MWVSYGHYAISDRKIGVKVLQLGYETDITLRINFDGIQITLYIGFKTSMASVVHGRYVDS